MREAGPCNCAINQGMLYAECLAGRRPQLPPKSGRRVRTVNYNCVLRALRRHRDPVTKALLDAEEAAQQRALEALLDQDTAEVRGLKA